MSVLVHQMWEQRLDLGGLFGSLEGLLLTVPILKPEERLIALAGFRLFAVVPAGLLLVHWPAVSRAVQRAVLLEGRRVALWEVVRSWEDSSQRDTDPDRPTSE